MAAYAALVSVMQIIDNLQHHPRPPIFLHKVQVYFLTQKITYLQGFLEGYNLQLEYNTESDPLEIRIADAAYAAEDVIESYIVDHITNDGKKMSTDAFYESLEKVIEEMAMIQKEAKKVKQTMVVNHQLQTKSTPPDSSTCSSSSIAQQSSMVGADELLLEMKDKLTSHLLDLQIIPIVGMGGSGKTTLARNLYQDRLIMEHFHICAWTTVSQEYSIQRLLIEVLSQLIENFDRQFDEDIFGEMLYKHLCGRKYLIIMDDMWSIDVWDRLRSFFPNNENGSRIVITTRLSNLASILSNSNNLEIELLDEADSWDLLSETVFGRIGFPILLEAIGKKIGKSCKGLPLSIVVVGGLLAKSKHTKEYWEYIEENLNSIVNSDDDERCLKILYMSYKELPVHLKPCFLYMGVFPEDEVITGSRLFKLWVAEGFLKPVSGKSLEEIGRVYLNDLRDRNLVLINEIGCTGNIKLCKIHDLLRDLCLREAEKERFYTPTSQGIVSGKQRRIAIPLSMYKKKFILQPPVFSPMAVARSLTCHFTTDKMLQPPIFRLLRILNSLRYKKFGSKNLDQLVNLQFLAIATVESVPRLPRSVWSLWNLQTLIVDVFKEVSAPTDIWCMPQIRHVQFRDGLRLPDPPNGQDVDIVLENLRTLWKIRNFKCSEEVVKRIPNIKKLKLYYWDEVDDDRYCLNNLVCLDKLESLCCIIDEEMNPKGLPDSSVRSLINFPHSLKKLILQIHKSECWEDILDKIGSLPLLQKLHLDGGCFKEGQWETNEGQFRSLKILAVIDCKDLQIWTTESSHFPCLNHLLLYGLCSLDEIPLDLADISTLNFIEVHHCSYSAVVSAKRIVEEQEELYGEEATLQVQVKLSRKNNALESLASPNFYFK